MFTVAVSASTAAVLTIGDKQMDMTGKELPLYRVKHAQNPAEHIIAHGDINRRPCNISVIRKDGDHLIVATVGDNRVAISGNQLLGVAASLEANHGS